jgi:hypothetical protein
MKPKAPWGLATRQPLTYATPRPANNAHPSPEGGRAPAVIWNDAEIMRRAGGTAEPGTTAFAHAVAELFTKNNQTPPTHWSVLQWGRRAGIPDRWRAALIYILMQEKLIMSGQIFRRNSPLTQ